MLRQTWLLAIAWYVLNYIMWTNGQPNIWFGAHLPKVTKTYQVQHQHQHLIHILVGFIDQAQVTLPCPIRAWCDNEIKYKIQNFKGKRNSKV